jgi:hypothetical protein
MEMLTMIEATSNYYTLRDAWEAVSSRFKRKPKQPRQEVLAPQAPQVWMPQTEVERTVFAALILAGEPVNNLKLAALMGVSPGECSRRVAQLEGVIRKARKGREVLISLH